MGTSRQISVRQLTTLLLLGATMVGASPSPAPLDLWSNEGLSPRARVVFFQNEFFLIAQELTSGVWSSSDGAHWRLRKAAPSRRGIIGLDANGLLVPSELPFSQILLSPDGDNWRKLTLPPMLNFEDITFGDETYAGVLDVREPGSYNTVLGWSKDAQNWNIIPGNYFAGGVSFTHGQFVAWVSQVVTSGPPAVLQESLVLS